MELHLFSRCPEEPGSRQEPLGPEFNENLTSLAVFPTQTDPIGGENPGQGQLLLDP